MDTSGGPPTRGTAKLSASVEDHNEASVTSGDLAEKKTLDSGHGSPASGLSPTMSGGSSAFANGCVRWCMNVALQSFTGEPWAVALRPVDDNMTGSFGQPPAGETRTPAQGQTTTATTRIAADTMNSSVASTLGDSHAQAGGSGNQSSNPLHATYGGRYGGGGTTAASRCGLYLSQVEYEPEAIAPVMEAGFTYDPHHEELQMLHQCIGAINDPPVTYGHDELLYRFTNVEFEPVAAGDDGQLHYRVRTPLDGLLHATLEPAVTAVVDHCVNACVLIYGATQEMKQMGLIGTPEECGLLPSGIRSLMEKVSERRENQQQQQQQQGNKKGGSSSDTGAMEDGSVDGGGSGKESVYSSSTFAFPSIGSSNHKFARVEATFIAFDSTSVVDLLDLNNKHVELVLQLAPPPTPSVFEDNTDDRMHGGTSSTTDSFVLNARTNVAETTNDALSALDVGLENLSHALELTLLQSESGSSLLFSLSVYTDNGRCATFHVMCLAEDPAAQTWLASTVLARSQAIPLGQEQSWASIQNTPMPPPLHHHAATMLVPALCFGNMFTSVLICVYNSITALGRLNRDLTFAVTGYRMRTIPRVTLASSRRSSRNLPPGWEEHFTEDGRRYYTDTTTQTTTWSDPRLTARPTSAGNSPKPGAPLSKSGQRPSRVGLGEGDRDFLSSKLQDQNTATSARGSLTSQRLDSPANIGIVVIDTLCRPRIVLNSPNADFGEQVAAEQVTLLAEQQAMKKKLEEDKRQLDEQRRHDLEEQMERQAREAQVNVKAPPALTRVHADPAAAMPQQTTSPTKPLVNVLHVQGGGGAGDDDDEDDCFLLRSGTSLVDDLELEDSESEAEKVNLAIQNAKFYANAMNEQIALPTTENAAAVTTEAATNNSSPLGSTTTVPPELQDLDSLVDEFARYFRESYDRDVRLRRLEQEQRDLAEATRRMYSVLERSENTPLKEKVGALFPLSVTNPKKTATRRSTDSALLTPEALETAWELLVNASSSAEHTATHHRLHAKTRGSGEAVEAIAAAAAPVSTSSGANTNTTTTTTGAAAVAATSSSSSSSSSPKLRTRHLKEKKKSGEELLSNGGEGAATTGHVHHHSLAESCSSTVLAEIQAKEQQLLRTTLQAYEKELQQLRSQLSSTTARRAAEADDARQLPTIESVLKDHENIYKATHANTTSNTLTSSTPQHEIKP